MPLQLCFLSSIVKKSSSISFLYDRPLKFAKTHKGSNTHFGWKIAKRSALPSEVTRQWRQGRRLTLTCLTIKIGILWSNHAQITLKYGEKPISAECVQIASNSVAPEARDKNGSHLQSDGWCSADFRSGHDHLWCGFWSVWWWWIAFPPMIILSFRIWNPSSGERSLLSYFKTWDLPECISPQQTV